MPVEKKGTTTVSTYAHPSSNPTPWHSINEAMKHLLVSCWSVDSIRYPLQKWLKDLSTGHTPWHVSHRHLMSWKGWGSAAKGVAWFGQAELFALKIVTPNTLSKGKRAQYQEIATAIFWFMFFFLHVCCFFVSSIIMWMLACETQRAKLFEIDF